MAAVFVADEQHHTRHSGLDEGTGIVTGAAGHPTKRDALVGGDDGKTSAEPNVHREDRRPTVRTELEANAMFALNGGDELLQPLADSAPRVLIDSATVEAEPHFAWYPAKAVQRRVRGDDAKGEDCVAALDLELPPELLDARDEIAECSDRVVPVRAGRAAGMRFDAVDARVAKTRPAHDRFDDSQWQPLGGQHRTLLDVRLEIAGD